MPVQGKKHLSVLAKKRSAAGSKPHDTPNSFPGKGGSTSLLLLCKVPAEGRFKHSRWSGLASVLPVKKGCYSLSHSCRHQALDRSLNLQHCQLTAVMAHHNLRDCSLRLESLHIGQRGLRMCSLFWQLRLRKESKCKLATSCPKGSAAKRRRNLSAA